MPGHHEGDDVYTFRREDVYKFAVALQATAVAVLKEADRRREAMMKKESKEWGSVGMKVQQSAERRLRGVVQLVSLVGDVVQ
jgi:hypothetical protein